MRPSGLPMELYVFTAELLMAGMYLIGMVSGVLFAYALTHAVG